MGQVTLDEDPVEKKKKDAKDKDRSRSREARRKEKKLRAYAEAAGMTDFDPVVFAKTMKDRLESGGSKNAAGDLMTGGTALGPMSTGIDDGNPWKSGICIKHLAGDCPMTSDTCQMKHVADPGERMKWVKYFNTQSCKHGPACTNPKCIYDHPNRKGWCGENVNLMVGTTL